jgi:hypothetical protein
LTSVKRFHLRCIGALFIFVVERSADAIADKAAERAADRRAGKTIAGSPTGNGSPDQRASAGAEQGPGILFWTRAHPVRTSGTSREHKTGSGNHCDF